MNEIVRLAEPLRTRRANLPVSALGTSKRVNRARLVLPAPMSSIDWLWPSRRASTIVPSGSFSATLSPVKANPPVKLPRYVTS